MINAVLYSVFFLAGFVAGVILLLFLKRKENTLLEEKSRLLENAFGNLSREALEKNQKSFFELANQQFGHLAQRSENQLDEKKKLIDHTLEEMRGKLENLSTQTTRLQGQLEENQKGIVQLSDHTASLRRILSNNQARGQWGERIVEDILNFMGLKEGVSYQKQIQKDGNRPDFTFLLPREKKVNMDVKFPFQKYEEFLQLEDESDKKRAKDQFLSDVRKHLKDVSKRDYVTADTLDYVLVFIPSESVYYFIHSEDKDLMDFALSNKIVLCSPITLYAVLSMVRQAVVNFSMEEKASEIQTLLSLFQKEWKKFTEKMDALGKSIGVVQTHFTELSTTRVNTLQRPLDRIVEYQLNEKNPTDL